MKNGIEAQGMSNLSAGDPVANMDELKFNPSMDFLDIPKLQLQVIHLFIYSSDSKIYYFKHELPSHNHEK